jgi:hypothetical protein
MAQQFQIPDELHDDLEILSDIVDDANHGTKTIK